MAASQSVRTGEGDVVVGAEERGSFVPHLAQLQKPECSQALKHMLLGTKAALFVAGLAL